MSVESEQATWKKIEEKTGEIAPGNILQLLLCTKEELEVLLKHPKVSKNQNKKIVKRMRWLDEAEKRRAKRKEKRQAGKLKSSKVRKGKIMTKEKFSENYHIGVDYATGAEMRDSEMLDLVRQAKWCYQKYRRVEDRNTVQYHMLGVSDENKDKKVRKFLNQFTPGWELWDAHKDKRVEDFKEKAIYLTAEADDTVENLEPGVVYIIGGVVDRNRLPGFCAERAKNLGIPQKKLPIREYIDMDSRSVLTINHVFEILLHVRAGYCWKDAFFTVLPERKNLSEKSEKADNNDNSEKNSADES